MKDPFRDIYKSCRKFEKIDFPRMVDVELTNYCNLNCKMCPTGNGTAKRKKGFMTGNVWGLVLKELIKYQTPVRFIRWGEPTLHRNLYEWVSEAKEGGLLTHINTNGKLLDVAEVLDCGLDSIKFSIHGRAPSCLKELYQSRHRPYISVHYYGTRPPILCGDEIRKMPVKDLTKPPKEYHRCPEVYNKLSVNWDGTVSACCADHSGGGMVGDVKNWFKGKRTDLKHAWDGAPMDAFRSMLDRLDHHKLSLCRNCSCEMF